MMMSSLLDAFRGFSQAVAPVVVTALWQGSILACALAACLRLAPRVSAAHRFAIWSAAFAALVLLPALPILIGAFSGGVSAVGALSLGSTRTSGEPLLRLDLRWSLAIGGLWIAASIARAVDLGIHSLRLRRLWKTARPVSAFLQQCGGPWSLALGDQGKRTLNLGRPAVEVCTTTELDRPSVIGFFAPRILIPEWLYARLTPEELEQVVLHESEHLRRHDDWTNLLQKLCLVLFPLNPALAWMERRLCREREMACDDGVVQATQAPRAYAACLASLAERGLQRRAEALSLGAWQRRPELVERVHRILRRTPGMSPIAATAFVGVLSCGLLFGSIEFARCPQLVAFVPAVRATAQSNAQAVQGDARLTNASYWMDGRGTSGFRAIDAVAHLPNTTHRVSRSTTATRKSADAPSAGLLNAKMPNAAAKQGEQQANQPTQQQWIVFTAWEQVESADSVQALRQQAGLRQDYDSSPSAEQATIDCKAQAGGGSSGQPVNQTAQPIRVTQLILRIYTAGSDSTFTTDQPALVPLRDGWFVFQL